MKTKIVSFILSAVLMAYPFIGSAGGKTFTSSGVRIVSLNAVTKTTAKKERQKRVKTCFKAAMRDGVIPESIDHAELKAARCRGDSALLVAVVPVSNLADPDSRDHLEQEMERLVDLDREEVTALSEELGIDLSGTGGVDRLLGLLVDFVGDDFFAVFDMSGLLTDQLSLMGFDGLERPQDGFMEFVASDGDLTDFAALFGVQLGDIPNPQSFYMDGASANPAAITGTSPPPAGSDEDDNDCGYVCAALAGAAAGAALGGAGGAVIGSQLDNNPTPSGLPARFQNIGNGTGNSSAGEGAAIGAAILGVLGAIAGVIIEAVGGDDDDDTEEETPAAPPEEPKVAVGPHDDSSCSSDGECGDGKKCSSGQCTDAGGETGGDGGDGTAAGTPCDPNIDCAGSTQPTAAEKKEAHKNWMQMWGGKDPRFVTTSQPGPDGDESGARGPREKPAGTFMGGKILDHYVYCPEDNPHCANQDKNRAEGGAPNAQDPRCRYVDDEEVCDLDRPGSGAPDGNGSGGEGVGGGEGGGGGGGE